MFTCKPLSDVEYYIESVNQELTNNVEAGLDAGQNSTATAQSRKRGDWSDRDRAAYCLDNGTGEKPSVWWTNARADAGQILPFLFYGTEFKAKDFRSLASGRDPLTQETLIQTGKKHRVGYDLQFSALKSVSVLWGQEPEIDAMGYLLRLTLQDNLKRRIRSTRTIWLTMSIVMR